ncbi:MAG: ribonuclease III [Alkalinema sp. RL_2_19]|nr:ribonuclease III [Alkalinema sp. RL_2_19]
MSLRYPRRQQELEKLLQRLGLAEAQISEAQTVDWALLDQALTHSTADPQHNYEQLEFVGDAVVKLAAAEFLLEVYPQLGVGEFTALRSVLVSDRVLAQIADGYGFERYLVVAASAQRDRAGRRSRLADALEAVLAVLYLSGRNLKLIRPWLDPHFQQLSRDILADPARKNYKAALQNWTQSHWKVLPEYRSQEISQIHNDPARFESAVWIQGECLGRARGRSIKAAQQAAAKQAFLKLSGPDQGAESTIEDGSSQSMGQPEA